MMLKLAAAFLLVPVLALANPFEDVSRETGIPQEHLIAVAKTESGLHPYSFAVWSRKRDSLLAAYCRKERKIKSRFGKYLYNGCYFKRKKDAEAFLTYLLSSPAVSNFSIGLMQINSKWIETLDISPYQLLDVKTNILLGALILKFYYEKEGDWIKALSRYYGKQKGVAWKYVKKVADNFQLADR